MKRVILTGFLVIALGGCYAHRGGAVPQIEPSTIAVPRMQRVMAYDLRVQSNVGDDFEVNRLADRHLQFTLRSAGADLRPSGTIADPDAVLSVLVKANGSPGAQMLSGFISGLSFGVIPGYAGVDLITEADVTERGGARKHYRYADSFSVWIEIFLLPFSNSPDRVVEDLIADMMRSLARDMQRDDLLPAPMRVSAAHASLEPAER